MKAFGFMFFGVLVSLSAAEASTVCSYRFYGSDARGVGEVIVKDRRDFVANKPGSVSRCGACTALTPPRHAYDGHSTFLDKYTRAEVIQESTPLTVEAVVASDSFGEESCNGFPKSITRRPPPPPKTIGEKAFEILLRAFW
jgi:hypothetical protein